MTAGRSGVHGPLFQSELQNNTLLIEIMLIKVRMNAELYM